MRRDRGRRPNHSLGAAMALGAVLAAHAVCWTVLLTGEARPAGIWPDGSRQSAVGSRSQERLPSAPRSASLRSAPLPPQSGVEDGRRLPTADTRLPFLLVHSAPSGWAYPVECCSNQDCREVADADVREGPDGYVIRATGEVVPYDDARVKDGPDGRFHWCALIERIERVQEDIDALADDRKEIYAEAKATGFDTKAIRTLVKLRRMDQAERQEAEAILDLYKAALGMA